MTVSPWASHAIVRQQVEGELGLEELVLLLPLGLTVKLQLVGALLEQHGRLQPRLVGNFDGALHRCPQRAVLNDYDRWRAGNRVCFDHSLNLLGCNC